MMEANALSMLVWPFPPGLNEAAAPRFSSKGASCAFVLVAPAVQAAKWSWYASSKMFPGHPRSPASTPD
eukprot:335680-Pyramimonas_sp.AAC.1